MLDQHATIRVARSSWVPWGVFALAVGLSLLFSLVVYPKLAGPYDAVLDPDGYGSIARGIWTYGDFCYIEDKGVTVFRGPVYPYFLALTLYASNGVWPQAAQITQCLFFGATCLLIYFMVGRMWGAKAATLAGLICAVHPLLIWYTSRIWIDSLLSFMFTLLMLSVTFLFERPSWKRAALVGMSLGVCILAKSNFIPIAIVLAIMLLLERITTFKQTLTILSVAAIMVIPWTIRNYDVTGSFIPVHIGAGVNVSEGDTRAEHASEYPLEFGPIFEKYHQPKLQQIVDTSGVISDKNPRWKNEVDIDRVLVKQSFDRYREDPSFLAWKVGYNSWQYWVGSQTKLKTIVVMILQVPLLLLFVAGVYQGTRTPLSKLVVTQLVVIMVYYLLHLPMEGQARYSLALIPTMVGFAVLPLISLRSGKATEPLA